MGPTARRGASTARRWCCSAPGRGRCSSSSPIRRSRPASTSTATSGPTRGRGCRRRSGATSTIVYGTSDGGTGGDPPPERAPPIDPRRGLRGTRPGPLAVGPRDARRHDDRRLRRLDRAAVPRRAGSLLRRDAADRAGVRGARRPAAARPRRVRVVRRRDARRPTGRSASRRRPASSPGTSSTRRWDRCCRRSPASHPSPTPGRSGRRSACCPRPSRADYGFRWGPLERAVSAWLVAVLAGLAAAPARELPTDAPGPVPPTAARGTAEPGFIRTGGSCALAVVSARPTEIEVHKRSPGTHPLLVGGPRSHVSPCPADVTRRRRAAHPRRLGWRCRRLEPP